MNEADAFPRAAIDPFEEEAGRLQHVLRTMEHALAGGPKPPVRDEDEEDQDEALTADEVADVAVAELARERRREIERAMREPYFGRIDFSPAGVGRQRLYIGKRGIDDPASGDRIVLDWRAPAASLFYSFAGQGDEASYVSPEGEVRGKVSLKRNIVVRDGELQRVVDSYVEGQDQAAATDEFLLYRLQDAKDSRLRDIVATIQAEQNDIIRADRSLPIVIQGVAGSGKTTVALHRLAYLLYQHPERLRAERMVIFAPSAMFVDYISEVLPELGVGGVQQTTFSAFALRVLDHAVLLVDPGERLRQRFALRQPPEYAAAMREVECKGRLETWHSLQAFLSESEQSMLPMGAAVAPFGRSLEHATIARWFFEEYANYPVFVRRQRVLARVRRHFEMEAKAAGQTDKSSKRKLAAAIRQYEERWPNMEPLTFYRRFLEWHPELTTSSLRQPEKRGARPQVQPEDLPLLLAIHQWLYGIDPRDRFDHVVIDEAQDFSPVHLQVLRAYCPSNSFTILGDLSQSIHSEAGIREWRAFIDQFPSGCRYVELSVSYRSTFEIIEFANRVLRPFGPAVEAKPVFRSGDKVLVEEVAWRDRFEAVLHRIMAMRELSSTVAVLTRTEEDAHVYHNACLEAGLDAHLLTADRGDYEGGISIVPIYLAKGLEFDSVIVVDADANHYNWSERDAKLLYVGCTRALHRLCILYAEPITQLLEWTKA
ncbi:DNA helicase [Alicyclobacillus hesperidum subsp. aegles]|uniref:HelD family protein n=1 Tax=Alicyclobacillus hesperidum TaxID=89784 RepID=UPI0007194283|nr:UvrD-helicase domain-containing protein [Alicyclobacillus hesperidum]GLG01636.1 DNA helicase [Alicyclobacillus hesperidum subsp. aegles]